MISLHSSSSASFTRKSNTPGRVTVQIVEIEGFHETGLVLFLGILVLGEDLGDRQSPPRRRRPVRWEELVLEIAPVDRMPEDQGGDDGADDHQGRNHLVHHAEESADKWEQDEPLVHESRGWSRRGKGLQVETGTFLKIFRKMVGIFEPFPDGALSRLPRRLLPEGGGAVFPVRFLPAVSA